MIGRDTRLTGEVQPPALSPQQLPRVPAPETEITEGSRGRRAHGDGGPRTTVFAWVRGGAALMWCWDLGSARPQSSGPRLCLCPEGWMMKWPLPAAAGGEG